MGDYVVQISGRLLIGQQCEGLQQLAYLHQVEAGNVADRRVGDDAQRLGVDHRAAQEVGEDQVSADQRGLQFWIRMSQKFRNIVC